MPSIRPYLLLTRISLAPSALVDAWVGLSIGTLGAGPGVPIVLLAGAASLCVFLGGMALNDWADRESDGATRPERPLPAGLIKPEQALAFALALLGLGVVLAFLVDGRAGILLACVALCASAYDVWIRGAWSGPIALGACRAGNLAFGILAGLSAAQAPLHSAYFLPALGYGLYVFCLSRLSAFEDGVRDIDTGGFGPAGWLRASAVVLALLPMSAFALRPLPESWVYLIAFGLSFSAAYGLWSRAQSVETWTPPLVGQSMGLALRRMMIATASLACMTWHAQPYAFFAVLAGLLGLQVSSRLKTYFPPS